MSIETTTTEKVDWEIGDEDELIETDLLEYPGQRRWAFDNKNIATGETSQAITPFHYFNYFHFFYYFRSWLRVQP